MLLYHNELMFHNTFEDLMAEVGGQRFRCGEENPYDRNPADYMRIGHKDFDRGEEKDIELLNHVLAMDIRAAARPVVQDVTLEVFDSGTEEIIDTGDQNLNKASDRYLSKQKVHGNPDALGAATVYLSSLLNNRKRTQGEFSDAAGINTVTMRDRYQGLSSDIFE